jgi:hypothetical protein
MKTLACWIGRHEWTTRSEHGHTYTVCAKCDREPPGALKGGTWESTSEPGPAPGGPGSS